MSTNQTYLVGFFIGLIVISLIGILMKSFMKIVLSCVIVFVVYRFCFMGGFNLNEKFNINQSLNSTITTNSKPIQEQYEEYNRNEEKRLTPEIKEFNSSIGNMLEEADGNKLFNQLKDTLNPKNIIEKIKN